MTQPQHLAPSTSHSVFRPNWKLRTFQVFVSLLCSFYIESAYELAGLERTGIAAGIFFHTFTLGSVVRFLFLCIGALIVLYLISDVPRLSFWVVSHRYFIAFILLVLLVLLEISGSSLALWSSFLGDEPFNGTLFGTPRTIRSDEWCVFTPFSFSQVASGNHAISNVIRGASTDVTMVYAQPAWCLATIFRPFLWGYLVLGASHGLAFFWCARALLLVLVTYDCMLLVTKGSKGLAAYASMLVGFAPIVEWWFAVNGTAELFIFGQGLVLSLHHLLNSGSALKKWAWSALLAWLLGCYALIFYPSWQIPLVYVFGSLGVWILIRWMRENQGTALASLRSLALPLVVTVTLFCGMACVAIVQAWDVVQAETSTVYPGSRSFAGGGYAHLLHHIAAPMLSTLWPELFAPNSCETAAFMSLFPLGLIFSTATLIRQKAQAKPLDGCILALLCVYSLLLAYGLVGFPPILAKLTLLNHTQTGRLPLAIGYLDIVLLVRALALRKEQAETTSGGARARLMVACAATTMLVTYYVILASNGFPDLMHSLTAKAVLILSTILLSIPVVLPSSFFTNTGHSRHTWLVTSAALVVVVGLCVNPLQRGANALLQSPTTQGVREVVQEDPNALWITDSAILGQACITVGAPTVTCINVYPNLCFWHILDPDGLHEDAYNRYAHVQMAVGESLSFDNPQADVLNVTVTPEDLLKINATYWLSSEDLSSWNNDRVEFAPIQTAGPYTIYRIINHAK